MSVIIKGMKLPLSGNMMVCALIDGKLQCSIVTRDKSIEWCEALEIPTPHGRLIDADRFLDWLKEFHPNDVAIMSGVKNARTVIEAEVKNEQRTKYAICRPYDGITLNTEVEFLLDQNGDVMLFDSESAAWEYFKPIGITEEELNAIKVVEYKERENNAGQNDT